NQPFYHVLKRAAELQSNGDALVVLSGTVCAKTLLLNFQVIGGSRRGQRLKQLRLWDLIRTDSRLSMIDPLLPIQPKSLFFEPDLVSTLLGAQILDLL